MDTKINEATLQSLIESRGWRYENRDDEIYASKDGREVRVGYKPRLLACGVSFLNNGRLKCLDDGFEEPEMVFGGEIWKEKGE